MSKGINLSINDVRSEKLLSMRVAADYIDVSYDTIKQMVAQNKIPFVVINQRKKFVKRYLDNWIESKLVPAIKE